MNYYPHHIGDYLAHAGHLDPIEDVCYRRCLDYYYLHEEPLPGDVACLAKRLRLREHQAELLSVLEEFFELDGGVYRHKRCDLEIAKYQDKSAKAKASGRLSGLARKANAEQTLSERSADGELTKTITNNQNQNQIEINTHSPGDEVTETVKRPSKYIAPFESIKNLYNEVCTDFVGCRKMDDDRKRLIDKWWRKRKQEDGFESEEEGLRLTRLYLEQAAERPFLRGEGARGAWRADIDFVFTEKKTTKIVEGAY